jgi:hypothetical protein
LADKSTQLVLSALSRAAAEPAGLPLVGSRGQPGLFAGTVAGKQSAQRCKDEGYLRLVQTATRGKSVVEFCALSDKGLAYLLGQVSPRQVLEDFLRALETRQASIDELLALAQRMQAGLDTLRASAETVLDHLRRQPPTDVNGAPAKPPDSEAWMAAALGCLERWQSASAPEDCPLPELCRQAQRVGPGLTVGRFHDGLRRLHDEGRIYLHPWTGPLHEIPEPAYALLVGHGIVYYASLREKNEGHR